MQLPLSAMFLAQRQQQSPCNKDGTGLGEDCTHRPSGTLSGSNLSISGHFKLNLNSIISFWEWNT